MFLPEFEYLQPETLSAALAILQAPGKPVYPLAGGTDLLVQMKDAALDPRRVLSLRRIRELRDISRTEQFCTLGSCVTIADLEEEARLGAENPVFRDLVRQMATPQIRNRATIGGNLCTAAACADSPPVLLVNDARVTLTSLGGSREVPLRDFFTAPRATVRKSGELLTAITFRRHNPGSAYVKFGIRNAAMIPVVGVAVSLSVQDRRIQDLRLAVTAAAPVPVLVSAVAERARGQAPSAETWQELAALVPAALDPLSDLRGSAGYRRHLAVVAARRALEKAWSRLNGGDRG